MTTKQPRGALKRAQRFVRPTPSTRMGCCVSGMQPKGSLRKVWGPAPTVKSEELTEPHSPPVEVDPQMRSSVSGPEGGPQKRSSVSEPEVDPKTRPSFSEPEDSGGSTDDGLSISCLASTPRDEEEELDLVADVKPRQLKRNECEGVDLPGGALCVANIAFTSASALASLLVYGQDAAGKTFFAIGVTFAIQSIDSYSWRRVTDPPAGGDDDDGGRLVNVTLPLDPDHEFRLHLVEEVDKFRVVVDGRGVTTMQKGTRTGTWCRRLELRFRGAPADDDDDADGADVIEVRRFEVSCKRNRKKLWLSDADLCDLNSSLRQRPRSPEPVGDLNEEADETGGTAPPATAAEGDDDEVIAESQQELPLVLREGQSDQLLLPCLQTGRLRLDMDIEGGMRSLFDVTLRTGSGARLLHVVVMFSSLTVSMTSYDPVTGHRFHEVTMALHPMYSFRGLRLVLTEMQRTYKLEIDGELLAECRRKNSSTPEDEEHPCGSVRVTGWKDEVKLRRFQVTSSRTGG